MPTNEQLVIYLQNHADRDAIHRWNHHQAVADVLGCSRMSLQQIELGRFSSATERPRVDRPSHWSDHELALAHQYRLHRFAYATRAALHPSP